MKAISMPTSSSSPLAFITAGLRRLDLFNKTAEDYRVRTLSGGITTILCALIMIALLLSELSHYASKKVHDELFVDVSREKRIDIDLAILFRRIPCVLLNLEISDPSGKHQHGVEKLLHRDDVDLDGNLIVLAANNNNLMQTTTPAACQSCYGAESATRKCCNSCSDIIEAYLEKGWAIDQMTGFDQCRREREKQNNAQINKQGCRLRGRFNVNRVSGGLSISPGRTLQIDKIHIHDLGSIDMSLYNTSHVIEQLSFGPHYPDKQYPLNQHEDADAAGASHTSYFLKIVPTIYARSRQRHPLYAPTSSDAVPTLSAQEEIVSYQFSVSKYSKSTAPAPIPAGGGGGFEQMLAGALTGRGGGGSSGVPGVMIQYEMSPLLIKYSENSRSFMHFLTNCCAIFGGIFAFAACIDLFTHQLVDAMKKRLGKFT